MGFTTCTALGVREVHPARSSVRYPLRLPVILLVNGGRREAVTADISASGVLFQLREPLHSGEEVEFLVEIPAGTLDFDKTAALQCWGRIVRSYWKSGKPWAAAVIDEYRFQ